MKKNKRNRPRSGRATGRACIPLQNEEDRKKNQKMMHMRDSDESWKRMIREREEMCEENASFYKPEKKKKECA